MLYVKNHTYDMKLLYFLLSNYIIEIKKKNERVGFY